MLTNRTLFFGDNLKVLRDKLDGSGDGFFDLIYLDPPFNSSRSYNVLFKEGDEDSQAQLHAFEDTWRWNAQTQTQFDELVSDRRYSQKVSDLMAGLERVVGKTDTLAYLTMMTVRLVELHQVLKSTGSLYLHCDPTVSHYLKVVLDAIFGVGSFRSEIVWKRSSAHSDTKQGRKIHGHIHDVILFYTKGNTWTWNPVYTPYDPDYIEDFYRHVEEGTGRRYRLSDLTAGKPGGDTSYEWKGVKPYKGRYWAYSKEKLALFDMEGRLAYSKTGMPSYKRYLDEMPGVPLQDLWTDIRPVGANERLGYATQKPEALLERIIRSGTNEGDWVLDPFGGCGTTAAAAEKLKRSWVVIDVSALAINLVKRRIEDMYPDAKPVMPVDGYPADVAGAATLAKSRPFDFEYWVCDLLDARPAGDKTKANMRGADRGIDGVISFPDQTERGIEHRKLLVQVKGGKNISSRDIRDLRGTVEREKAAGGIFVSLAEPSAAMRKDAAQAGSYAYALTGQKYPTLQLLTVAELLAGKRPEHPSAVAYSKKARKAEEDLRTQMF